MRYQARMHPTLDILCDSMGRVFVPGDTWHKGHWTFGYLQPDGYRKVRIDKKNYSVARLICETFHGLAPEDRPTCDHIDRNRDSNVPENLRWASRKTQADNTTNVDRGIKTYGIRECEDKNAYERALRAKNPEYAERRRAACREYHAKQKAHRLAAKEN